MQEPPRTVAQEIDRLALAVEAIASRTVGYNQLTGIAYAMTDAANLAHHPKLRAVFDVTVDEAMAMGRPAPPPPPRRAERPRPQAGTKVARDRILAYVTQCPRADTVGIARGCGVSRTWASLTLNTLSAHGAVRRLRGRPARWERIEHA